MGLVEKLLHFFHVVRFLSVGFVVVPHSLPVWSILIPSLTESSHQGDKALEYPCEGLSRLGLSRWEEPP